MVYSRFEDIKERDSYLSKINLDQQNITKSGFPIYYEDNSMYYANNSDHTLIIGCNESGKTELMSLPITDLSIKAGESMIIYDPTTEIYKNTIEAFKGNNYKIINLDLNNLNESNKWNPLDEAYKLYKNNNISAAIELLEDISDQIMIEKNVDTDPFWTNESKNLFIGTTLYLFSDENTNEVSINSVHNQLIELQEDRQNVIKKLANHSNPGYKYLTNAANSPSETFLSICSVLNQKLGLLSYKPELCNLLSSSDFSFKEISQEKSVVFIKGTRNLSHIISSIFISNFYKLNEFENNKTKFNILIEEFDTLNPINNLASILSKSNNIKFYLTTSSFDSIQEKYGDEAYIQELCGNIVYLLTNTLSTLKELSKYCGKKNNDEDLVSTADLQLFKYGEALIIQRRHYPIKTQLISYKLEK